MGNPAARLSDPTAHGGVITIGMPLVTIGGLPAARIGDMHTCPQVTAVVPHVGGPVALGAFTVLTGGTPQSRQGDVAVCVGPPDSIAMGCPTVLVGMVGGGGGMSFATVFGGLLAGFRNMIAGPSSSAGAPPSAFLKPGPGQLVHAREMSDFAADVYNDAGAPPGATRLSDDPSSLPPNLQDFPFHDSASGFDSALYETADGRIVVAYRGTEPTSGKDWETNLKQGVGFQSEQHDHAVDLAKRVQDAYPDRQVEITGHSLGGGLAQVASASTGYPATTFNSAGVHNKTFARYGNDVSQVQSTNYTVNGEALTSLQELPLSPMPGAGGQRVPLQAMDAGGQPLTMNPVERHSMTSVQGSLDHAIAEESKP